MVLFFFRLFTRLGRPALPVPLPSSLLSRDGWSIPFVFRPASRPEGLKALNLWSPPQPDRLDQRRRLLHGGALDGPVGQLPHLRGQGEPEPERSGAGALWGGLLRPATPRRAGARFSVTRRRHAPSASLASRCPESLVYDPRPREGVDFLRSTGCPEAFVGLRLELEPKHRHTPIVRIPLLRARVCT